MLVGRQRAGDSSSSSEESPCVPHSCSTECPALRISGRLSARLRLEGLFLRPPQGSGGTSRSGQAHERLERRVAPAKPGVEVLDFDLHRLAAIRLVGATPGDAAAVARQLGPLQAVVDREPDLVIRFVDGLERSSRVRYIGLDDAGFTDDAFLVLRSKHKSPARVKIDFSQLGGPTEIVCERGVAAVPLLIPILNMTLLARGVLPLHASAFVHEGTGVVATGWSKGGRPRRFWRSPPAARSTSATSGSMSRATVRASTGSPNRFGSGAGGCGNYPSTSA